MTREWANEVQALAAIEEIDCWFIDEWIHTRDRRNKVARINLEGVQGWNPRELANLIIDNHEALLPLSIYMELPRDRHEKRR